MMRNSVYEFACICGQHFEVEDPHEFLCPRCGRALVVEWRGPEPATFTGMQVLEAHSGRESFSVAHSSLAACRW
jgi:DNA-directed RNA polymerase subunit RPC12/RpoP